MDFKTITKLVDNIIENELRHVQEENEVTDLKKNIELQETINKRKELGNILENALPKELQRTFNEFVDSFAHEQIEHEKYYFRKGVDAGLDNISYLKDFGLNNAI